MDERLWAREVAEHILLENGGDIGLMGSKQAYQQVWARDSMICGLGLMLIGDPTGQTIHKKSLETLGVYQSELGKVPHNVGFPNAKDPALIAFSGLKEENALGKPVQDTAHAGCVDGNLWFIIGHYYYYMITKDTSFLEKWWGHLERALLWLRYQDSNECGLLEVHEAKDWADLFANRYNVLLDNVLYATSWKCMGYMAKALHKPSTYYFEQAKDVKEKINILLWVDAKDQEKVPWAASNRKEWLYPIKKAEVELVERPYYLPYVAFRDFADRFDTLGNLLAIVFGIADEEKANQILDYIHGCGLNEPFPVKAVYPVIQQGDKDWRDYYKVRNLNLPHHYHNGGAWPFIGGFYVAALIQAKRYEEAEYHFGKLTEMNKQGKENAWEFNEWFHGLSGRPMGYAGQSWSAGMYIFAERAVKDRKISIFNEVNDWSL